MSMCHSWLMFPEIMSQLWPMGSPYMFCSVLDCLTNEVPQVQWSSVTPPDGGSGSVSAPSEVASFLAEINKLASSSPSGLTHALDAPAGAGLKAPAQPPSVGGRYAASLLPQREARCRTSSTGRPAFGLSVFIVLIT